MRRRYGEHRKKSRFKRVLAVLVLVALVWLGLAAFRTGGAPSLAVVSDLPGIGPATEISVEAEQPGRGVSRLTVELHQGDLHEILVDRGYETPEPWKLWSSGTTSDAVTVEVGREAQPGLGEGEAIIRVSAWPAPAWLRRGAPTVRELTLPVKLKPPLLQVVSTQHYVSQGGAEAVVYRVGETAARHGVEVDGWFFPGHPLPGGGAEEMFALFAAPYDCEDPGGIQLVAADDVGNEYRRNFVDQYFGQPMRNDTIQLSTSFMEKVVPEILSQTPEISDRGDLLESYLAINGELRRRNAETLIELSRESTPGFAWDEVFLPMPNAQVMSAFADRRTYVFEGETVDQQDHLGFDLASVRRAPVPAANSGRVVLARYFGIYGNAVVVDHGYGLMSLYAHLSEIAVSAGESVARGQTVGTSGETGLAGGDHLHFTMLLDGLAVNPKEWWDEHWLRDRLGRKLGEALPMTAGEEG